MPNPQAALTAAARDANPSRPPAVDSGRLREVEAEITARWGEGRMDPTTDRIAALLDLLGEPQRAYRGIHLTGTNGKTTTARMIDELLRAFGLRTGRYTSPHLSSITERIVLDGEPISADAFVATYEEIEPYIAMVDQQFDIRLSFFEVITAMAYAAFADAPVDVAVVEVGLGGTWDATNRLDGEIAVITPIGIDHVEFLGDSVGQIATEKAGIIKAGASAILAAQSGEAAGPLLHRVAEVGATVAREGIEFGVLARAEALGGQLLTLQGLGGVYGEVFLPLFGAHQAENAVVALAAVETFFGIGETSGTLDGDTVREAFAAVRSPGRLEPVRTAPTVLVDATHNPQGMAATVATLNDSFSFRRLIGVFAALAGKDVRGMLDLLEPVLDELVVTENSSPRTMPADELAEIAVDVFGPDRVTVEARLDSAIETAVTLAEETSDDFLSGAGVIITGSVVTAGEARTLLTGRRR